MSEAQASEATAKSQDFKGVGLDDVTGAVASSGPDEAWSDGPQLDVGGDEPDFAAFDQDLGTEVDDEPDFALSPFPDGDDSPPDEDTTS